MHGKIGADPPVHVAPRRHAGPHARVGADPRGDDGDGGRVPGRALQCAVRDVPGGERGGGGRGRAYGAVLGDDRAEAVGHQTRARVLHRLAAGLHVPRRRDGRDGGRHLPPRDARVLQGAAVPRLRQRHLRDAPRLSRHAQPRRRPGHAQHGRPAAASAVDVDGDVDRDAGDRRGAAAVGVLLQG